MRGSYCLIHSLYITCTSAEFRTDHSSSTGQSARRLRTSLANDQPIGRERELWKGGESAEIKRSYSGPRKPELQFGIIGSVHIAAGQVTARPGSTDRAAGTRAVCVGRETLSTGVHTIRTDRLKLKVCDCNPAEGMGNSSRKEAEDKGGEEKEKKDKEKGDEGEEEVEEEEEEVVEDEELPLGVDDLLASGDPVLDLSYYKFRRLPRQVLDLEYLEKLYVCGNRLRDVPKGITRLQGLRTLALDFNKLEDVPLTVCKLTNLTCLYLGSNRLMSLPPEVGNLQSLRCLWVESNYFQRFPKQLYDLPNLRSLQIGDNRLRTLPSDLWRMEALRGLWLYGNRFQEFPRVLLKMEQLEILDMDRNRISEFPNLHHLPALRLFSYDHNPVKEPPRVGEEVLIVGEGAEEVLQARERRKEAKERAEKEAEEAAAAAAAAANPVIHGILKKLRMSSALNLAAAKEKETNGSGPSTGDEDGTQNNDKEAEFERQSVAFHEAELGYDDDGLEYEREELVYEGEGYEGYEGAELEYERSEMDYEYEGEEQEEP
ncbi:Leucine-rich repeat-containing protein 10B [Anabarilius grahami]|uniref:Leucine-rich repeat-containing protein 10B n=1 Tax=Anabarilius grahami TaxID=495550 RepID=A0A3N0XIV9_ANAGA|nr:Leucine-rich repeat-containing protein 10B [Anabarilius grahami]